MTEEEPDKTSRPPQEKPLEQIPLGAFADVDLPNRRASLLQIASVVLAGCSAAFSAANLMVSVDRNREDRERDKRDREERAAAKNLEARRKAFDQQAVVQKLLFGDENAVQYYIPGTNNPYSGIPGVTPHVAYAFTSIVEKLGFTEDTIQSVDQPQTPRLDGSVLLLGGPVPNAFTRQIMGIGRGSPIFSRASGKTIDLPVSFRNILTPAPTVGHRPEYELVVNGSSLRDVRWADRDYLVLTSVPNIFSNAYGTFNHRIFIAAGLHGGGMRAMHLLLNQPDVLNEIVSEAHNYHRREHGWQALIRVDKADLTQGITGELREKRVFPLRINFGQARKAFEKKSFWIDPQDQLLRI